MNPSIITEFQNVLVCHWNPTPFTSCDLATMDLLPLTLVFFLIYFNAIFKGYNPFIVTTEY